jgi:hypothetical protein
MERSYASGFAGLGVDEGDDLDRVRRSRVEGLGEGTCVDGHDENMLNESVFTRVKFR